MQIHQDRIWDNCYNAEQPTSAKKGARDQGKGSIS